MSLDTRQTVLHQDHVDQLTAALELPTDTALERWIRRDALLEGLPPMLRRVLGTASAEVMDGVARFVLTFGQDAMAAVHTMLKEEGWIKQIRKAPPVTAGPPAFTLKSLQDQLIGAGLVRDGMARMQDALIPPRKISAYTKLERHDAVRDLANRQTVMALDPAGFDRLQRRVCQSYDLLAHYDPSRSALRFSVNPAVESKGGD